MESPAIATGVSSGRHRYLAVDLASLPADRQLSFDLYVNVEGNTILYREKSLPFSEEVRKRLMEHRVKQVYIHEKQRQAYLGYMKSSCRDSCVTNSYPRPPRLISCTPPPR